MRPIEDVTPFELSSGDLCMNSRFEGGRITTVNGHVVSILWETGVEETHDLRSLTTRIYWQRRTA